MLIDDILKGFSGFLHGKDLIDMWINAFGKQLIDLLKDLLISFDETVVKVFPVLPPRRPFNIGAKI